MISLERARTLLGAEAQAMSQQQLTTLCEYLYTWANIGIDDFIRSRNGAEHVN